MKKVSQRQAEAAARAVGKAYGAEPDLLRGPVPRTAHRSRAQCQMSAVRIVHNRILGGWFVVRGPHQTPLSERFNSREAAKAWLNERRTR